MLKEFDNLRQHKDGFRRLFSDDYFDLFIWYAEKGLDPVGFQLCYNKKSNEHSLIWDRDKGFLHSKVDTGESDALANRSPVLVADGLFDSNRVAEKFLNSSQEVDDEIVNLVYHQLKAYDSRKENPFL